MNATPTRAGGREGSEKKQRQVDDGADRDEDCAGNGPSSPELRGDVARVLHRRTHRGHGQRRDSGTDQKVANRELSPTTRSPRRPRIVQPKYESHQPLRHSIREADDGEAGENGPGLPHHAVSGTSDLCRWPPQRLVPAAIQCHRREATSYARHPARSSSVSGTIRAFPTTVARRTRPGLSPGNGSARRWPRVSAASGAQPAPRPAARQDGSARSAPAARLRAARRSP